MSIVRVYGTINGQGYLPFQNIGDRYYFPLPEALTGRYVCEFWAEDEFGNVGYNAAILTLVRGVIKCIEVLTSRYKAVMLRDPKRTEMGMGAYRVKLGNGPTLSLVPSPYRVSMIPLTCRRDMMEVV